MWVVLFLFSFVLWLRWFVSGPVYRWINDLINELFQSSPSQRTSLTNFLTPDARYKPGIAPIEVYRLPGWSQGLQKSPAHLGKPPYAAKTTHFRLHR